MFLGVMSEELKEYMLRVFILSRVTQGVKLIQATQLRKQVALTGQQHTDDQTRCDSDKAINSCSVREKAMVNHSCIFTKKTIQIENIVMEKSVWSLAYENDQMAHKQYNIGHHTY